MKNAIKVSNDKLPNKLAPFIWRYLKNKKTFLLGFFFIALIWAINMSFSPYLLKVMIDSVILYSTNQTKMFTAVLIPASLYVVMSIIINLAFRLQDYLHLRLFPEIKSRIGRDLFAYLLNHSQAFFQNTFTGSLTNKIGDLVVNTEAIIIFIKNTVMTRVLALIISSFTLFIVVSPIFGIILFLWTIIFVCISYIVATHSEKIARDYSEAASRLGGTLSDEISNIISIKLFANNIEEIAYLDRDLNHLVTSDRKFLWTNLKANLFHGFGVSILIAVMIAALIYGRIHGSISVGDFVLVLMLSTSFVMSLDDMRQQILEFTRVIGRCNQSLSFIRVPHDITNLANAQPIYITKGKIQFKNVSFHYKRNSPLFDDVNITIQPGEKVGLVGYSGGGKSTFIKLILRLIDTNSGNVLIDDQDIKKVIIHSLNKQIGTIPQESELFHRTILENIRFARMDANNDEVIEASKKARCHEFICELPEQYQTLVGERGFKLSGGQRQRIAIARAFLKNAPILILDEATSSLDSITERYIQDSLHDVMINKTTIVIAHRLSTLKNMDRILVFVRGRIVEDGSLESLLENKQGHFYKLWQMQAEGFLPSIFEYS